MWWGWFQDRMEFGPRALGNRSILADPRNPEMQKNPEFKNKIQGRIPALRSGSIGGRSVRIFRKRISFSLYVVYRFSSSKMGNVPKLTINRKGRCKTVFKIPSLLFLP